MRWSSAATADGGLTNDIVLEIVTAVAEAENTDPLELSPPLGDVVAPEALESFLRTAEDGATIEFSYRGWEIEVSSDGEIEVR